MKNEQLLASGQQSKRKSRFRLELTHQNHRVIITDAKDKGCYKNFVISSYVDGRRKQVRRANLADAKREANFILTKLVQREQDVLTLTSGDRLAYLRACEILSKANVPLDVAVSEYVHAQTLLNGTGTITEAVRFFAKHHLGFQHNVWVPQTVDELLEARQNDGSSPLHVDDLECRLRPFAKAFSCPIGDVHEGDIHTFLMGLKLAPRTKNNYRMAISNLFSFARLKKYVPADHDPLRFVPEFKEPVKPVEIITASALRKLLENVRPEFMAYLAIAAFAGLRSSELQRLRWEHITKDYIRVPPGQYRVKSTRLVPIQPNLRLWLDRCPKNDTAVVPFKNPINQLVTLFQKAGVELKHNCLRHSFGSFRVAVTQNVAEVSMEMGNSVAMIRRHYLEIVPKEEGIAWFSIAPPAMDKVIELPKADPPQAAGPEKAVSRDGLTCKAELRGRERS
jgi:integrase